MVLVTDYGSWHRLWFLSQTMVLVTVVKSIPCSFRCVRLLYSCSTSYYHHLSPAWSKSSSSHTGHHPPPTPAPHPSQAPPVSQTAHQSQPPHSEVPISGLSLKRSSPLSRKTWRSRWRTTSLSYQRTSCLVSRSLEGWGWSSTFMRPTNRWELYFSCAVYNSEKAIQHMLWDKFIFCAVIGGVRQS